MSCAIFNQYNYLIQLSFSVTVSDSISELLFLRYFFTNTNQFYLTLAHIIRRREVCFRLLLLKDKAFKIFLSMLPFSIFYLLFWKVFQARRLDDLFYLCINIFAGRDTAPAIRMSVFMTLTMFIRKHKCLPPRYATIYCPARINYFPESGIQHNGVINVNLHYRPLKLCLHRIKLIKYRMQVHNYKYKINPTRNLQSLINISILILSVNN